MDAKNSVVRTRFAPSPTGALHVGGIRTALFAWLVARQASGKFILRIEDTDQAREVEGAVAQIISSLKALGLDYDEGPDKEGQFEPYFQSKRLEIYKKWADKLIASGRAYADPFTAEEVQKFREDAQAAKQPFLYRNHRPQNPPTWDANQPLRFKAEPKSYEWHDEVMGDLSAGPEVVDDFILIKTDGFPTYNFAHIVDDAEMEITHVIRGQEFISSMPNYLNLYEALEIPRPVFATLPHILAPSGYKKLSKRDGARDILEYIKDGYLPEALVSFIATLGWNDGTEQEIFSREELIQKFSLDRVGRSGAHFDEQRLIWMNGHYIRESALDELLLLVDSYWPESARPTDENYKHKVLGLVQERLKFFAELSSLTNFFFEDLPVDMKLVDDNKQLSKFSHAELADLLYTAKTELERSDFTAEDLTSRLNSLLETTGQKPGILFSLIRIATTWAPSSPGLAETLSLLGKDKSIARINTSIKTLST